MHQRSHKSWYRWAIGVAVIAALALLVRHRGEPKQFAHVIANAHPVWLIACGALQLATYSCIALIWTYVIRRSCARPPRFAALLRLSIAELFTDQTLPSAGMSGTVLVVASLKKHKVPKRAAMAAVLSSLGGFYVAQLVLVIAAFIVFAAAHRLGGWAVPATIIALIASLLMPLPLALALTGVMTKLPKRILRLRFVSELHEHLEDVPRDIVLSPRVIATSTGLRLAVLVLDGLTLTAALAALGSPLHPVIVIAAFALAFVVGSASFLPGGIGTFEATAITLLVSLGIPIEAAAPATMLMRGFSFWLPMLPGVLFAHREAKRTGDPACAPAA